MAGEFGDFVAQLDQGRQAEAAGERSITPYWRTLKNGGEINPKYPGGAEAVAARLRAEGHKITHKGKRFLVSDYEKAVYAELK